MPGIDDRDGISAVRSAPRGRGRNAYAYAASARDVDGEKTFVVDMSTLVRYLSRLRTSNRAFG